MVCRIVLLLTGIAVFAASAASPNILIILADDMGYGDMGCMGSERLVTPHLDALAASGVLCSQAYVASPVCSPSRAGLITGRDPRRFGYEGNLNQSAANYATRPGAVGAPTWRTHAGRSLCARSGYQHGVDRQVAPRQGRRFPSRINAALTTSAACSEAATATFPSRIRTS